MYFPPRMFPGFLGPEALKLSVTPAHQAELVCFPQQCNIASCGSRAVTALARVWGRTAPSVSSLSALKFTLENKPVIIYEYEWYNLWQEQTLFPTTIQIAFVMI